MKKQYLFVAFVTALLLVPIAFVSATGSSTRSFDPRGASTLRKPTPPPDPVPDGGAPITGEKYALIIGISDYDGTANDLSYCDDDAMDWYAYFNGLGYQIILLIDEQATEANILGALQDIADVEDEAGDAIAICYSGHGYYDRQAKESCLIAWELTGVFTSEIAAITDTFQSQHIFFFDDACNQGTMDGLLNPGWVAAIGSTTKTYTYDGDASMENGIFTYYAMEAIALGYETAEAISGYAVDLFDANTQGDATLYDAYTIGDFYFV